MNELSHSRDTMATAIREKSTFDLIISTYKRFCVCLNDFSSLVEFYSNFGTISLLTGEADKVKTLIRLRAELSPLFTGKRNASKYAWA
jgi:hypothetical protein